jgi:hypothetical protein
VEVNVETPDGIEDIVDELLALPPEGFTEARNAAARRLRAEGRRDAADAIKGLPKPAVSLWALNQLAHEQPSLVETFLRSADQLREAYRSGGDIRAASSPEREAEARVVSAATDLVRAGGKKVTEAVLDRLRQTMRAAAADAEIASALRDGRLLREPAVPSIDELLGSMPRAARAPTSKSVPKSKMAPRSTAGRQPDHEARRAELRDEIAVAESDASEAHSEARGAERMERAAQREWERAQKLAERAQQRRDAAARRLEDLQQRLADL